MISNESLFGRPQSKSESVSTQAMDDWLSLDGNGRHFDRTTVERLSPFDGMLVRFGSW